MPQGKGAQARRSEGQEATHKGLTGGPCRGSGPQLPSAQGTSRAPGATGGVEAWPWHSAGACVTATPASVVVYMLIGTVRELEAARCGGVAQKKYERADESPTRWHAHAHSSARIHTPLWLRGCELHRLGGCGDRGATVRAVSGCIGWRAVLLAVCLHLRARGRVVHGV